MHFLTIPYSKILTVHRRRCTEEKEIMKRETPRGKGVSDGLPWGDQGTKDFKDPRIKIIIVSKVIPSSLS